MPTPIPLSSLDAAVDLILQRVPTPLVLAAPLGLGKPHRLLNALYRRIAADPARQLHVHTALSLTPPSPGAGLERRFLAPFLTRHFGAAFEPLDWTLAQRRDRLPPNITVAEFYLQSGALLRSDSAQRDYASINYTHVARGMAGRGINLIVQMVARDPATGRLSLSCNPDLTADLLDRIAARGEPRPFMVAEVHPDLPFLPGDAALEASAFDAILDLPGPAPRLFAPPRAPVSDAESAIGLHASTLVRDGGTLQIGIGALADALSHALLLRQTGNTAYRAALVALAGDAGDPARAPTVRDSGGCAPLQAGLHGASEMLTDGFMRLVDAGVIRRRVLDDLALMQHLHDGTADADDHARLAREGHLLRGGFFLGSHDFYRWLQARAATDPQAVSMTRISRINQLPPGEEALVRLQRPQARFFNTCMMMTALGAAVSDALEDGRVVSGVGGQYNFVALGHALPGARSVLMLRATRGDGAEARSSVLWSYGHTTIPRHLRDLVVTEYGVADLRDRTDAECVQAMLAITDARFIDALVAQAKAAGKLPRDFQPPAHWRHNTPERLAAALRPFRVDGTLPDYPMGSDFTPVEQHLARALGWLKRRAATRSSRLRLLWTALRTPTGADVAEALARMALHAPTTWRDRLDARLLALALRQTA